MVHSDIQNYDVEGDAGRTSAVTSLRTLRGEYFLLTFLLALFVFRSFIPAWQDLNTDFRVYYVAARLSAARTQFTSLPRARWRSRMDFSLPHCHCFGSL